MLPLYRAIRCAVPATLLFLSLVSVRAESGLEMRGWDTIPPEELEATSPKIDPNAHIEFTYRNLRVNDAGSKGTVFTYRQRAKIFTEAGVQELDKIDIPYETGWRVTDIKARVVYPDGTVKVLERGDVYKRQIFKDDKFSGYAKSFSFPGLKPGCIVDYKWKQTRRYWAPSLTVLLRAEWPTWKSDLSINPWTGMASMFTWRNGRVNAEKKKGNYTISAKNLPAASSKPYLAPRFDFEPWIHMAYAPKLEILESENYWGYRGGALVEINKDFIKPKQKRIKDLAARLFEGIKFDEDKLKAAYDYCANEILNIDEYQTVYTEEELEDLKENNSPNDTLKNGYGSRYDINGVFASLAAAAGFSSHLAQVENHDVFTYNRTVVGEFNLSDWVVAVRHGVTWRYFDPGSSFLPFETLNAENVKADTIQTDKKFYYMAATPSVADDFSTVNRIADVVVDEYGDLSGKINIQYNGYSGIARKRLLQTMSADEAEEYVLENDWQNRLPRATIKNFEIKNGNSREKSLVLSYDVKIAGYADVIQDRILLQPSLFETGRSPMFEDEKRVEPISFGFKARVMDKVTIDIPEGFEMESQASVSTAHEGMLTKRKALAMIEGETGHLVFQREYSLKGIRANANIYNVVKREFDHISEADSRPVSFKKAAKQTASVD